MNASTKRPYETQAFQRPFASKESGLLDIKNEVVTFAKSFWYGIPMGFELGLLLLRKIQVQSLESMSLESFGLSRMSNTSDKGTTFRDGAARVGMQLRSSPK
ncbi:hypothetical protein Tco_0758977, partial [Tanacetum coccineum]